MSYTGCPFPNPPMMKGGADDGPSKAPAPTEEGGKSEVAREIFEKIKRSRVMLGHPAKIICLRATPTGEVEEIVEDWVVPQSRIEELEKKYIGGKTDEDISD